MPDIGDLDVVTTTRTVTADVIGQSRQITLPAGTVGTVVLVHHKDNAVAAFEVEFSLGELSYALATVPRDAVIRVQSV